MEQAKEVSTGLGAFLQVGSKLSDPPGEGHSKTRSWAAEEQGKPEGQNLGVISEEQD